MYTYASNNPVNYIDPTGHNCRSANDGEYDNTCPKPEDPAPTPKQPVDKKPVSQGMEIWLYEDGTWQIVNAQTGQPVQLDQVQQAEVTVDGEWIGGVTKSALWIGLVGEIAPGVPGLAVCATSLGRLICGGALDKAIDKAKALELQGEVPIPLLPMVPLVTPVPDAGTVNVVVFRQDGGQIWNMSFRVTGSDVILVQDWRRYK